MTFFTLLGTSLLLFTCSLIVGYLPVILVAPSSASSNLTPNPAHSHSSPALKKRRWITTIGVGILIGVAFAIILPEGISSMYQPPREQVLLPTQRVLPTDQSYTLKPTHSIGSTPGPLSPLPSPSSSSSSSDSSSTDLEGLFAAVVKATTTPDSSSNSNTDWQGSMSKFKVETPATKTPKKQDTHVHAPAAAAGEKEQGHAHGHSHSHGEGVVLKTTKITAPAPTRTLLSTDHAHDHDHDHDHSHEHASSTPAAAAATTPSTPSTRRSSSPVSSSRFVDVDTPVGSHSQDSSSSSSQHSHAEEELRSAISHATAFITNPVILHCFDEGHGSSKMGFAMVIGFAIMLLFERIKGQYDSGHHVQNIDVEMQISASPAMSGNRGSNAPASDQLRSRAGERANAAAAAAAASGSSSASSSTASSSSSSANSLVAPDQNENLGAGLSSPELRAARERDMINVGASPRLGLGLPKEQTHVVHATPITSPAPHMNFPHHHAAGVGERKFDPFVLAGVFVYALVDGFILGANAVGATGAVDSRMFYAIMVHKAPTAFGLVCFLLYQGRTVSDIRKQLALFALTTPLSSLVMFCVLGATDLRRLGDGSFLGLCMLFSGGCYVFTVAMHILPEIQNQQHHQPKQQISPMSGNSTQSPSPSVSSSSSIVIASASDANGGGNDADAAEKSLSWQSVWLLIFGMCLPLAASYYQERAPLIS